MWGKPSTPILAKMPPAQRARSDAICEGGLFAAVVGFSDDCNRECGCCCGSVGRRGMRNLDRELTRFGPLQTVLYWIQFIIACLCSLSPHRVRGYFREHHTAF